MKAETVIEAGVCGFKTTVQADCEDGQNVAITISSDCKNIKGLGKELQEQGPFDAFQEISPEGESNILKIARSRLKGGCAGCVVPCGIFKTMQTAACLALPQDINLQMKTL